MAIAILLVTATDARASQSQFAGTWRTRISTITRKSAITVRIVETGKTITGTVLLTNLDGKEIEVPIVHAKSSGTGIGSSNSLVVETIYLSGR